MVKPHVHAELIKAWADGAIIQIQEDDGTWMDCYENDPLWQQSNKYRVKPKMRKCWVLLMKGHDGPWTCTADNQEEFTGRTGMREFVRVLQEVEYEE